MALSVMWRRKMGNHTKRVKLRVQNTLFGFFLFVHYFANLNSQSVCFISPAGPATNSTCSARRKTTHRWPDISRDWPWAWCVWILTSTQIHIKPGFFLFVCFFIFFMPFRRKKKNLFVWMRGQNRIFFLQNICILVDKVFCVFLSGVGFFCIYTVLYRWVYACAVTHAVYCSDSRHCGEDSVVQWWLNPWDSKRSVLRKTLKRPADQRSFKLDNSLSAQQVRFLS